MPGSRIFQIFEKQQSGQHNVPHLFYFDEDDLSSYGVSNLEEDHPENCKAEAQSEAVDREPEDASDDEDDGPEDDGHDEDSLEDFMDDNEVEDRHEDDDAREKPHEVDAGENVEDKEEKIESRVENVDCDHHHKAEFGRDQIFQKRESLKSKEEQGGLNNHLLS